MMVSNTVLIDLMALFNSFQGFSGNLINIISNIITAGFELGGGLIQFPKGPERDAFTAVSSFALSAWIRLKLILRVKS